MGMDLKDIYQENSKKQNKDFEREDECIKDLNREDECLKDLNREDFDREDECIMSEKQDPKNQEPYLKNQEPYLKNQQSFTVKNQQSYTVKNHTMSENIKDLLYSKSKLIESSIKVPKPSEASSKFGFPNPPARILSISQNEIEKEMILKIDKKEKNLLKEEFTLNDKISGNNQKLIFEDQKTFISNTLNENFTINENHINSISKEDLKFDQKYVSNNDLNSDSNIDYQHKNKDYQYIKNSLFDQKIFSNIHKLNSKKLESLKIIPDRIHIDGRKTCMIKNIPNKYTFRNLKEFIDLKHEGKYDFLYLRMDFINKCNVGYAFISFVNTEAVETFYNLINGHRWCKFGSEKIAALNYATIQGVENLIKKFQNSTVLEKNPDYRPKLFYTSGEKAGMEKPFEETKQNRRFK